MYSDGVVCDALLTAKLCDYAWLSASMGFQDSEAFYLSGRWSLRQQTPLDQVWSGLSVDTNEAKPTFGEFVPLLDVAGQKSRLLLLGPRLQPGLIQRASYDVGADDCGGGVARHLRCLDCWA